MIEVLAERIGSPVDPTLLVQQVRDDGSTRDAAEADDQNDPRDRQPIRRRDGRPDAAVPGPGGRDLSGDRRRPGQRPPDRPGGQLSPGHPPRAARLPPLRRAGRPGPARGIDGPRRRPGCRPMWSPTGSTASTGRSGSRPRGCPAGVTAEPAVIGGTEAQAPIVFTADGRRAGRRSGPSASSAAGCRATARRCSRRVEDAPVGPEPERSAAVAGSITWAPAQNNAPAPARVTRGLVLAVRPGAPFTIAVGPSTVVAPRGRQVRADGERHPPRGVRRRGPDHRRRPAEPDERRQRQDREGQGLEATLTLTVPGNVEPGIYTFLLRGTAKVTITDPKDGQGTAT